MVEEEEATNKGGIEIQSSIFFCLFTKIMVFSFYVHSQNRYFTFYQTN